MVHKIFFENKCLVIYPREMKTIPEGDIFIPSDDVESSYRKVCAGFKEVYAAGGLVCSDGSSCLLIRRNGLWDLPKGHQEEGEDIETTALREVQEETGVNGLEMGNLICITDHCYRINGIWHLKHTSWYEMFCKNGGSLSPQTEEGITEAVWVSESELPSCLENTYSSIIEVFKNFLETAKQISKKGV